MFFCLWEANKPEDIVATLGVLMDYMTIDLLHVDEIADLDQTLRVWPGEP